MELLISLDWNGPRLGAAKEKRHSGGWPGLASAARTVTYTVTPENRAGVWLTTRYWISDFLAGSATIRSPVTSMPFDKGFETARAGTLAVTAAAAAAGVSAAF